MNTIEIADRIASERGLTKAAAKQAIETVVTAIVNAAAQGEEVSLSGFGKFKVTEERLIGFLGVGWGRLQRSNDEMQFLCCVAWM